jgi:hypothetical protein
MSFLHKLQIKEAVLELEVKAKFRMLCHLERSEPGARLRAATKSKDLFEASFATARFFDFVRSSTSRVSDILTRPTLLAVFLH